ncbi:MAG: hypothetical protein K9J17_17130 [Flavobacteriales bacterium]|nr:hypothetical protein [Flavobacteriales bacterium]
MNLRYILLLSSLIVLLAACKKEDDGADVVNSWKLIEVLADPGDGSGTFEPVTSNKRIEFYTDSTLTCTGTLCQMSSESGPITFATYSETNHTITGQNCGFSPFVILYEINGSELILSYPCIEPCREKYQLQ